MIKVWAITELKDICKIKMGQSPPSSTYNFNGDGLPFFQGKAEFTKIYPVVKKWCSKPKKTADKNDILVSVRAPVGSTNIANKKCAIGRGLASISYDPCYKFIWFYMNFIEQKLSSQGTGSTFSAISGKILGSKKIPLPPLPEQRAMVSKIDQLFSELDNGIKNLEQAQEKLAIYRQAVLKKAFEGELTIDYRLKNKLSNWSKNNFGSLCNFTGGGTPSKKHKNYWNGDINWASIKDIKGNYLTTTRDKISKHGLDNSSAKIAKKGELIIGTRINPGRPIITKIDTSINQDLKIARPKEKLNIKFLFYLFKQKENQILNVSNGTTVLGINLSNLNEITFEYPNSVKEQQQIVQEIEYRFSICDALEKNIKKGLQQAKNLKQSILKKAFDGKLLSQDELAVCQKEPDWEPASELLKKIKAEKEKQK